MFKLSALIGGSAFLFSSWFSGLSLPRFTYSSADYVLMPLFSYIMIIIAAQLATKVLPEQD
jgi:hypothetical protein